MVQFFQQGNPQGRLAESLGMSLGQGLGNGLNTYFANRSLDSVLKDKSLDKAPTSEKLGRLQSALAPYGETGQNLFNQRMQIEQQVAQEKQEAQMAKKEALQQQQSEVIGKILNKQPVSEKERSLLSPEQQMAIAKHEQVIELQNLKNQGKAAPGGLTGQSVPPEVSNKINDVLKNSEGMSADQLKQSFDQQGIPPIYSNQYVENRRQDTKPVFEPESDKLEAKRVADYATQIEKEYLTAKNENVRLNRQLELSNKEGLSSPLMVKALDAIGLPIGVLSNPDTEEFRKLETDFIRDARDVFPGGRITNYEIESYLRTIPSLMNSKEGREAIIRNRKLFNDAKEIRYNAYKDIVKENGGRRPPNLFMQLEDLVSDQISELEDKFREGIQKEIRKTQAALRMVDPQGNPVDIPPDLVESALKAGAKFK